MSGTSIGAQNARGDFDGRDSRSRCTFCLPVQVDAEIGERVLERGQHLLARVELVELRRPEETRHVPGAGLVQADPEPVAEEAVALALPQPFRLVEEHATFVGELGEAEAEAKVELVVVRGIECTHGVAVDRGRLEVDRVQPLVEQSHPSALDLLALRAVGLVRHCDTEHPVRDRLPSTVVSSSASTRATRA